MSFENCEHNNLKFNIENEMKIKGKSSEKPFEKFILDQKNLIKVNISDIKVFSQLFISLRHNKTTSILKTKPINK